MKNIVLTGLSGSGKSTLGQAAAQKAGMRFIDMDTVIEQKVRMPISRIFKEYGETYFRDVESEIAFELSDCDNTIIATGGGVVVREENMRALSKNALVVFIDRPVQKIAQDIHCENRPLLSKGAEKLFEMDKERRPLYLSYADVLLQNTAEEEEALSKLIAIIEGERMDSGYGVIGDPISHTLSPADYKAVHVPKSKLELFINRIRTTSVRGLNVTIPHKQEIIKYIDVVDREAKLCHAVNTVVVYDGKLTGYNTDMQGFASSLKDRGYTLRDSSILILGTGGAASAVALKAVLEGAKEITILGRDQTKADTIRSGIDKAVQANINTGCMTIPSITKYAAKADILVNATPLGMSGIQQDFTDTSFLTVLPKNAIVYDLIYNPTQTTLLYEAEQLGLNTQNGLGMLIYQALIADELFMGRALPKDTLYKSISDILCSRTQHNK